MKCKRRKAIFGIDDIAIATLIGSLVSAGTQVYGASKQAKAIREQNELQNAANINQQNMLLANNYDSIANNRDYIDDRQRNISINTRHTNELAMGGKRYKMKRRSFGGLKCW